MHTNTHRGEGGEDLLGAGPRHLEEGAPPFLIGPTVGNDVGTEGGSYA